MNINNYDEIVNGKETYKEIALILLRDNIVGIGWTDENDTHLDIVFSLGILKYGTFQRGIKDNYLFVSIIGHTSYAFIPNTIKDSSYFKEKLRFNNKCGDKLAELINGIISYLTK